MVDFKGVLLVDNELFIVVNIDVILDVRTALVVVEDKLFIVDKLFVAMVGESIVLIGDKSFVVGDVNVIELEEIFDDVEGNEVAEDTKAFNFPQSDTLNT